MTFIRKQSILPGSANMSMSVRSPSVLCRNEGLHTTHSTSIILNPSQLKVWLRGRRQIGPGLRTALRPTRMRAVDPFLSPPGIFLAATAIVAALLAPTTEAFLQAQIEALRQPLRDLVGNRADELCLNCQALECLFCYKDKL